MGDKILVILDLLQNEKDPKIKKLLELLIEEYKNS